MNTDAKDTPAPTGGGAPAAPAGTGGGPPALPDRKPDVNSVKDKVAEIEGKTKNDASTAPQNYDPKQTPQQPDSKGINDKDAKKILGDLMQVLEKNKKLAKPTPADKRQEQLTSMAGALLTAPLEFKLKFDEKLNKISLECTNNKMVSNEIKDAIRAARALRNRRGRRRVRGMARRGRMIAPRAVGMAATEHVSGPATAAKRKVSRSRSRRSRLRGAGSSSVSRTRRGRGRGRGRRRRSRKMMS